MNGGNDVAVSLGRYKDKTIAELADALQEALSQWESWTRDQLEGTSFFKPAMRQIEGIKAVLAHARLDPSWQRYSRDNQEPLSLEE